MKEMPFIHEYSFYKESWRGGKAYYRTRREGGGLIMSCFDKPYQQTKH